MSIRRMSTSTLTQQERLATMATAFTLSSLVVAGGGSGGRDNNAAAGGGGAGGLVEDSFLAGGETFSLSVGAGAPGRSDQGPGSQGTDSVFSNLTAIGGGAGGGVDVTSAIQDGGSGGGGRGADAQPGGEGLQPASSSGGLGSDGGDGSAGSGSERCGGGGGGASGVGETPSINASIADGGAGFSSDLTGSSVTYATGGNGRPRNFGSGSSGSGNTGDGGEASGNGTSGSGGSGVIIFTVRAGASVSFSAGVTQSSSTVGDDDVYTVTATDPGSTVTIS